MVSFVCEVCQDVVKKNQIDNHCRQKCPSSWNFTCVDCNQCFAGFDYSQHNSCITEAEKYGPKTTATTKRTATTETLNDKPPKELKKRKKENAESSSELKKSEVWSWVGAIDDCLEKNGNEMFWLELVQIVVAKRMGADAKMKNIWSTTTHSAMEFECIRSIPATYVKNGSHMVVRPKGS